MIYVYVHFAFTYIHTFFGIIKSHLATPECSVLDFPNLLPYNLPVEFGDLTTFKILSDPLILIWDYFGCSMHEPYI